MKTANQEFIEWYEQWYNESVIEQMSISLMLPNSFNMIADNPDNYIILNSFKALFVSVDTSKYLKEFIDHADKFKIDIYTDCYLPFNEQIKRGITKEDLIEYFSKFGFEKYAKNDLFLVRHCKQA